MKHNEKLLVYAVTGFLVVILAIAILFGKDTPRQLPGDLSRTTEQAAMPPSLEEVLNRGRAATEDAGKKKGDEAASHGAAADAGTAGGSVVAPVPADASAKGAPTSPNLGLPAPDQPLAMNVQLLPPTPAALVTEKLGLSRREHAFRIVRARAGDTLGALVQKWCGSAGDYLEQAKGLNEELLTLRVGQEVVLPWVDDEALLAAFDSRTVAAPAVADAPAAHPNPALEAASGLVDPKAQKPAPSSGRKYTIKSGDSLWKIAEREVGRKQASRFLEQVRQLNPGLDTDRIRVGQEIVLPAKG